MTAAKAAISGCYAIKVFEGEIDIFVAIQQIVASIGS